MALGVQTPVTLQTIGQDMTGLAYVPPPMYDPIQFLAQSQAAQQLSQQQEQARRQKEYADLMSKTFEDAQFDDESFLNNQYTQLMLDSAPLWSQPGFTASNPSDPRAMEFNLKIRTLDDMADKSAAQKAKYDEYMAIVKKEDFYDKAEQERIVREATYGPGGQYINPAQREENYKTLDKKLQDPHIYNTTKAVHKYTTTLTAEERKIQTERYGGMGLMRDEKSVKSRFWRARRNPDGSIMYSDDAGQNPILEPGIGPEHITQFFDANPEAAMAYRVRALDEIGYEGDYYDDYSVTRFLAEKGTNLDDLISPVVEKDLQEANKVIESTSVTMMGKYSASGSSSTDTDAMSQAQFAATRALDGNPQAIGELKGILMPHGDLVQDTYQGKPVLRYTPKERDEFGKPARTIVIPINHEGAKNKWPASSLEEGYGQLIQIFNESFTAKNRELPTQTMGESDGFSFTE